MGGPCSSSRVLCFQLDEQKFNSPPSFKASVAKTLNSTADAQLDMRRQRQSAADGTAI